MKNRTINFRISVVIPVYNEESVIGRCLESVGGQSLQAKEIVIVDDGSTDNTKRVLSEIINKKSYIRYFSQPHSGAGAARNFGVSKAAGEILVFGDADMRFSRTFLEELTMPIREGKSRGTFSKSEFIGNWDSLWARFWNYQKGIYEPRAIPVDYPETAPVFRAILKSEFEKAGGFDESRGYTDDWSLSQRLGYRAAVTKARYYHDNPASLREVFWQARWAGKRRYKWGFWGMLGVLGRGTIRLILNGSKLAETWFSMLVLYPIFWGAYTIATLIGYIEFFFSKKVAK